MLNGNNRTLPFEQRWEISASLAALSRLRRSVGEAAREVMPDSAYSAASDVALAVGEVLANVGRHAYRGGVGDCRVVFTWDGVTVRVVVEDDGEGFPPALCDQSGPAWVAESESGRGLQLVRSLVDEIRCTNRHGGGAVVALTKRAPSK